MFMFPSPLAGAKDQPRPSQRTEDQPPSGWGSALSPLRRRIEEEQLPELAGSKRAAPEQGSSGRPAKKSRVRSKM
jgi:hypothetical protein